MNFALLQARFQRQYQSSKAWKLLRAKNAPLILSFMADLFSESSEVSFGKARVALDAELQRCREADLWQSETNAFGYVREWIQSGWLRELDDQLSLTDASDVALRFCQSLDQRENVATASHLRVVQEAVRDFSVAISPDPRERTRLLKARQAEIQFEIDALEAGVVVQLTELEQRERIKEIYQLASVLTGDFRRVEDDIREMDQKLRVDMIESGHTRGEILLGVLEKENKLADTDAGRAFEGFFQLLCDQNRSLEFREQIRSILSRPVAKHLSLQQNRFLSQLMRELSRESERVFQVRRRSEESLRSYIESGAHLESKVIDQCLAKLERHAVGFREAGVDPRTLLGIDLPSGSVKIASTESMKLKLPDEALDTRNVEEQTNSDRPSDSMLDCLDSIKVLEVASSMQSILRSEGPQTLAGISRHYPVQSGLEELVACLRVAKAIGATALGNNEELHITDKKGHRLKATVPVLLLQAEQFPANLEDMDL
jgi:hypothetical protein